MRTLLSLLSFSLVACSGISIGGPSIEEMNAVRAIADPSVDATPASAPFLRGQRRDVGGANTVLVSPQPNEYVERVALPGDLDGDGIDDLVLAGWIGNPPDTVPCEMGCPGFSQLAVRIVYGRTSLGSDTSFTGDALIESWHVNDLRYAIAAAGDVDGDGRPDLLVSIGTNGCDQGSVYLVRGGARLSGTTDVRDVGSLLRESGTCAHFGDATGVGDVDGDGRADFAIAASGANRVYLYYGAAGDPPPRRSELDADATLAVDAPDEIGNALAVGDVDGDGHDDFVLGLDVGDDGEHPLWLVRGGAERLHGETNVTARATRIDAVRIDGLGDLDGDGLDELVATVATGTRDAFVLRGRHDWPATLDARVDAGAWIERDVAITPHDPVLATRAGDVDGDGHGDFVYGDPSYATEMGVPRGAIYLFRGPFATTGGGVPFSASTAFLGQDWSSVLEPDHRRGVDRLGESIGAGSDLNGDGLDDLVLVARSAPDDGRVYLWLGRSAS